MKRGCRSRHFEYRGLNEFGGAAAGPGQDLSDIDQRHRYNGNPLVWPWRRRCCSGCWSGNGIDHWRFGRGATLLRWTISLLRRLLPGGICRADRLWRTGVGGYCLSRYRSFDPISGTYRGRDGRRHYCR